MPSGTPRLRRYGATLLAATAVCAAGVVTSDQTSALATAQQRSESEVYLGETIPSERVELPFAELGKVAEVRVKEGDLVEAGDVLMVQDDRTDKAQLRALVAQADVAGRIALAEQRRDLAEVQLRRLDQKQRQGGNASAIEVEEAELNKAIAETQITEERRQGLVAEAEVEGQQVVVDERVLKSPASGVVRSIEASVGEVFGPQTPALTLVTIDPLEVEVELVPADIVADMKLGETVRVRYLDEDEWRDATITFIDPVVNVSTGRRFFKLEMPNPELRPAGLNVEVQVPEGN